MTIVWVYFHLGNWSVHPPTENSLLSLFLIFFPPSRNIDIRLWTYGAKVDQSSRWNGLVWSIAKATPLAELQVVPLS